MIYTIEINESRRYQTTSANAALDFAFVFGAVLISSKKYDGPAIDYILFLRP